MISIFCEKKRYELDDHALYKDFAKLIQKDFPHRILLIEENYRLRELNHPARDKAEVRPVTTAEPAGIETYRRSTVLLMMKAFSDVTEGKAEVTVDYSLSKGLYCRLHGEKVTEKLLIAVGSRMTELVKEDLPIEKKDVNTVEAMERFAQNGMPDKEHLLSYRRSARVNLYCLGGYEDYYYGCMAPSTGCLGCFALYLYDEGFVLQMPVKEAPETLPPFEPQKMVFGALKEATGWGEKLGISTVGDLNDQVTKGKMTDLILVQEALMEKKIAEIADAVASDRKKKIVLIAGPSSSGKTTFSYRLSIQLRAVGLKPHPIGVDDYFVDRVNTPKDEEGNYNYEDLGAIDTKQLSEDLERLLKGETVQMPSYNFVKGVREYKGKTLSAGPDDILVIEGIHCLNDALTPQVPRENKYKIYISALTQLNVDEHNRIPTTDGRLIRRMVRDARTRGNSAKDTIAMWQSVRRGEEKNIFPYQDTADVVFNSALIYELAVLKSYAEPLLFSVPRDCEEYIEAKRLLKFLDYFVGINPEQIPCNSIVREFVGGGCFPV